ncbi:hypothetical protein [Jeotgalibacillus sp. R-1-5s-1]|uniref:hypothetical protein n=1 Tax=Jeotgalibacillus sp. R-1-5s-1 TaxID=2555897 RepID=UPI0010693592|nr:hypothetical protein [Jeotgalibacillus sp. R-1-5s-1]TFD97026.1 hypothetical protein E2491_10035 [Jeotgalibacillus sp. R-1-5s-1]
MTFRFLEGLKDPVRLIESLHNSESVLHIKRKITVLLLLSMFIFGFGAWIGMGTQDWAGNFVLFFGLEYDLQRFYFLLGRLCLGLGFAGLFIFLPALLYSLLAHDFSYKKGLVLAFFPAAILVLEQFTYLILMIWQGINWYSSPFSWGVIGQLLIKQEWLIYFVGAISLFKIWVMYWQFLTLRALVTLKWWAVLLIVLGANIILWAVTATLEWLPWYGYLFN